MNTHSPYKDFTFYHLEKVDDRKVAETFVHKVLSGYRHKKTEWFQIAPSDALELFKLLNRKDTYEPLLDAHRRRQTSVG